MKAAMAEFREELMIVLVFSETEKAIKDHMDKKRTKCQ